MGSSTYLLTGPRFHSHAVCFTSRVCSLAPGISPAHDPRISLRWRDLRTRCLYRGPQARYMSPWLARGCLGLQTVAYLTATKALNSVFDYPNYTRCWALGHGRTPHCLSLLVVGLSFMAPSPSVLEVGSSLGIVSSPHGTVQSLQRNIACTKGAKQAMSWHR